MNHVQPSDIDFAVAIAALFTGFSVSALFMYSFLLAVYAWPHRLRGLGWFESLMRARRELA